MEHTALKSEGAFPSRAGFTLIEILVALVVLLFGFMASISAVTGSVRSGKLASDQTMAVFLAEGQIEALRDTKQDILTTVPATFFDVTGKGVPASAPASSKYFTRTVDIQEKKPTQFTNQITVTVTWPGNNRVVVRSLVPTPLLSS
jgi:type IV pilus assembly protein PilV